VAKKPIITGVICFVLGAACAGLFVFIFGPGRTGPVDELAAANARAAEGTVTELGRTVEQQREIIGNLESENNRLKEHIRDAIGISATLAGTVEASGTNTASAIEVSKRLRVGINALENWHNNLLRGEPWVADMGAD
jgi:hypothetical protein